MPEDRRNVQRTVRVKFGFRMLTAGTGRGRKHETWGLYDSSDRRILSTQISRGTKYRTLGDDVLHKIARGCGLSMPQMRDAISCELGADDYKEMIRSRGYDLA